MGDVIERLLEVEKRARAVIAQAESDAARIVEQARDEARDILATGREEARRDAGELVERNAGALAEQREAALREARAALPDPDALSKEALAPAARLAADAVAFGATRRRQQPEG